MSESAIEKQSCPICGGVGQFSFTSADLLTSLPGDFRYDACTECDALYQVPTPTMEQIASFYPQEYSPFKPGKAKERNAIERSVLRSCYGYRQLRGGLPDGLAALLGRFIYRDLIPFVVDGRLLDIGCGGGKYLLSMRHMGWQGEGVELNEQAVEACRQSGLEVFHGVLTDAAYMDNSFDLVTARHVIEHIPDLNPFIAEVFRVVKPGGLMVLRTPNSAALGRGWFGTNWFANEVPRHLTLFSEKNLEYLAVQHGFRQVTAKTFTTPKIVLNSWDYLVGNRPESSKRRKLHRLIARIYVMMAALSGRGDELFMIFEKPKEH